MRGGGGGGNASSSADVLQANNKSNKRVHYCRHAWVSFQVGECIHMSAINYMAASANASVYVCVGPNRLGGHTYITLLLWKAGGSSIEYGIAEKLS